MSVLVRVANLRVSFVTRQTRVEAVRGVSFDARHDATLALVGESGSGKTVSAMSILRLLPDNAIVDAASRVDYGGENLLAAPAARLRALRGRDISAVFQEPMSSLNPVLTVGEQVAEVLRLHRRMNARQALERAAELADDVGVGREGEVREGGPPERIFSAPRDPYTRALLACRPRLDARPRRLRVIDDFMRGGAARGAALERPPAGANLIEAKGL